MPLSSFLNTKYPLIQAPMAGSQDIKMALQVSMAGGLGSLPTATLNYQQLEQNLQEWQQHGSLPLNVNFFAHSMPELKTKNIAQWQKVLTPYTEQYQITLDKIDFDDVRKPFNEQHLKLLEQYKPPIVSFHFGLPEKNLVNEIHRLGIKIISSATTVEEARWLDAHQADYIIAQGLEAGGHRGMFLSEDITTQIGTFSLLPQILAVTKKPIIAAGGITNHKSIQAAMQLGASAVQLGTSFLLCNESLITQHHRTTLKSKQIEHTALTNLYSGRPARGIVNSFMKELQYIHPNTLPFPYASSLLQPIAQEAKQQGCFDFSPLWCGQNAQGCQEIGAKELTQYLCQAFH